MKSTAVELLKYKDPFEDLDSSTFPQFVQKVLLKRFPGLVAFGENKDGGIDLCADDPSQGRVVFQCKFLESRASKPTKKWQSDRKNLGENLKFAEDGNLLGEVQYLPWSDPATPIRRYIFCHSGHSRHLRERDEIAAADKILRSDIETFFRSILGKREGFKHLQTLDVEVISGDDLLKVSRGEDRLMFSLFGTALPDGIEEIAAPAPAPAPAPAVKRFDHYLSSEQLEYYPRGLFKTKVPDSSFLDEGDLLQKLFNLPPEEPVFVITGPGGYGKTRLTLEVCKLAAREQNALVYRLSEDVAASAVEELCRMLPAQPAILLVDYLETQSSFEQIVSMVARLNQDSLTNVRIIANCRASYYRAEVSHELIAVLDLSERSTSDSEGAYRKEVFFHILELAGLGRPEEFGAGCGYNPVLAAFVLYLVEGSSDGADLIPELRNLVNDPTYRRDLSGWLVRRLLRSAHAMIGEMSVATLLKTVAPLMALLPLRQHEMLLLRKRPGLGEILEVLTHDRLVENRSEERAVDAPANARHRWVATHDVVADYFLTQFFESAADIEAAVETIFDLAEEVSSVRNPILAVQRIGETRTLAAFAWKTFFTRRLRERPTDWMGTRLEVLRSQLMSPEAKIALLREQEAVWQGIKTDPLFDRTVIRITDSYARWRKACDDAIANDDQTLIPFLEAAIGRDATFSGITRALRYNPVYFQEQSLRIIKESAVTVDQHFLLVAWLDAGLDFVAVEEHVLAWLKAHVETEKGQFVLFAALENASRAAKGHEVAAHAIAALRPYLHRWMDDEGRRSSMEARFVFGSWLRAATRAGRTEASEALKTLLPSLKQWVDAHADAQDSQYLMSYWLRAAGTAGGTFASHAMNMLEQPILTWLDGTGRASSAEAGNLLGSLFMAARRQSTLTKRVISTFGTHLAAWLEGNGPQSRRAAYVFHDWLIAAGNAGSTVRQEVVRQLAPHIVAWMQPSGRPVSAAADLIYSGWIAVLGRLPDELRAWAADLIRPFFQRWAADRQETSYGPGIIDSWSKAEAGAAGSIDRNWEALSDLAHTLWMNPEESALEHAEKEIWAVAESFNPPTGLNKHVRADILYNLIQRSDELVYFPRLRPALGALLAAAGRHVDLLEEPLARGQMRLMHVLLLEHALAGLAASGEVEAVSRVVRYLTHSRINEQQRQSILNALTRLRREFPNADIWNAMNPELGEAGPDTPTDEPPISV